MILETAAGIWSSIARPLGNHLWQSTAFGAIAALLALVLRKNQARTRYWLWMAASVKFLLPFAWLSAIGSRLGAWLIPAAPAPRVSALAVKLSEPFMMPDGVFAPASALAAATHPAVPLWPAVLLAVWFSGSAIILIAWWRRWWRVRTVVRAAQPLREGREWEALRRLRARGLPEAHVGQVDNLRRVGNPPRRLQTGAQDSILPHVSLLSSAAGMEPGIFGILRPVLWLPEGIAEHLSEDQLEAILAHELCHLRCRDNLAAVLHMAVEALFWFHPLVWWIGARLVEERERACDETVLQLTGAPQAYAEGVLNICKFYVASPLDCSAGVTGADLKKRIEGIMRNRFTPGLSLGKRLLLVSAAVVVVAGPVSIGLMNAPQIHAQSRPLSIATIAPVPAAATAIASDNRAGSTAAAPQVPPAPASQPPAASAAVPEAKPVPVAFEVASVKRAERCEIGRTIDAASVTLAGVPLKPILITAFGVRNDQIEGPSWLETDCFDISAKIPAGVSLDRLPEMLQALLTERLKLAAHKEDRSLPGNVLVVDKGGLKAKEDDPNTNFTGPGRAGAVLIGRAGVGRLKGVMTIASLAGYLSGRGYGPVQDGTGLTGRYDIDLSWAPNLDFEPRPLDPAASAATPPSADLPVAPQANLFAALRDQLGLRLERRNVTAQFLVIDHIERVPTEN